MQRLYLIPATVIVLLTFTQNMVADEKWDWSDDRASIMHYFMNSSANYQVELVRRSMADLGEVTVQIGNGKESLHQFKTHSGGSFVFEESLVIYSKHNPHFSGCELLAYDLNKQKFAWRIRMKGLGPIEHFKYRNRINLSTRAGEVIVMGDESAGQYIEVIDIKTGDRLSHRVGQGEHRRFKQK